MIKRILILFAISFSLFLSGCLSEFKDVDITKSGFGAPNVITLPPKHKLVSASFRSGNLVVLHRPFRGNEFPEEYVLETPAGYRHTIIKEVE